jgi:hypothetical protein
MIQILSVAVEQAGTRIGLLRYHQITIMPCVVQTRACVYVPPMAGNRDTTFRASVTLVVVGGLAYG